MSGRRILFVDRDGTIIVEPADKQIDAFDKLAFLDGAIAGLRLLAQNGYELVLVSNQDGLGTPAFPQRDFDGPHALMKRVLDSAGVRFAAERICPHLPSAGCDCRKPAAGLVRDFLAADDWSRAHSAVIGDRETDIAFAANLGVRGLRVDPAGGAGWPELVAELTQPRRQAQVRRRTRETDVHAHVDLAEGAPTRIETGIGFFDHMLEQLAKHGGFGLELRCEGDLHIDEHHTVEDCALTLGQALGQVIADKRGLARYGFVVPMDEALARVSLDLSGRPYCRVEADLRRERVGGLPTELVPHFFSSLADSARLTLHIDARGDNDHHVIEGAFKATGRALRQALTRYGGSLPSTKGVL